MRKASRAAAHVNRALKKSPAVKLNPKRPHAFLALTSMGNPRGLRVNEETQALVERWIKTFCEAPILIDAELMRRVLAEHEACDQRKTT